MGPLKTRNEGTEDVGSAPYNLDQDGNRQAPHAMAIRLAP